MADDTCNNTTVPVSMRRRNYVRLKKRLIEHRGLLAAFVGSLCYAIQNICVKLLKDEMPVMELAWLRFFLQGICSCMLGLFSGMSISFDSRREGALLLARAITGSSTICVIYFAMYNMPVGMVSTIVFGAPVFVGIFAWIIWREKFYYCDILLVLINITGIVLIAQPPFLFKSETLDTSKKMELVAIVAAIVGMLGATLNIIMLRQLGLMGTSANKVVFYFSLGGTIIPLCIGLAMQDWVLPPCGSVRYIVFVMGLINFVAQWLVAYALASIRQSYFFSVINSAQVPVTIVLELLIFGDAPDWISVLGTCLVISSALGVVFREGTLIMSQRKEESDAIDVHNESNNLNEQVDMISSQNKEETEER